jgi:hypothetical protein
MSTVNCTGSKKNNHGIVLLHFDERGEAVCPICGCVYFTEENLVEYGRAVHKRGGAEAVMLPRKEEK